MSATHTVDPVAGSERLVECVTALSQARTLDAVVDVVRRGARELVGADGATFVLREGSLCHYVDEHAIGPLWKGRRFPMTACVSGWVMLNREPAVIGDVFADPRVPAEAYRPTFVKSLVMVPIRRQAPIGAIGVYWAHPHTADGAEVRLLQALADITSVTLENVELYCGLERRVEERTAELTEANARLAAVNTDLEAFAGAVAHDLRSPVTAVSGFAELLDRTAGHTLDETSKRYLSRVRGAAGRMAGIIESLLSLSRSNHVSLTRRPIDVRALAESVIASLRAASPDRCVDVVIGDLPTVEADEALVRLVLENLLGNAWKFTRHHPTARIEVGADTTGPTPVFYVRDDGDGLPTTDPDRLFRPFFRGENVVGVEGHGLGLATVLRAVERHGGRVWAESPPDRGACFRFTLAPG